MERDLEQVVERFKRLFDANEPGKGGSFYLQSKILRARERIEKDIKERIEWEQETEEMEGGWKPKVWRDK